MPSLVRLGLITCILCLATRATSAGESADLTVPIELKVDDQKVSTTNGIIAVPITHKSVDFTVGSVLPEDQNTQRRVRFKLEPFDSDWREMPSTMSLMVRFMDSAGDQVGQKRFQISGQSAGWTGTIESSPFVPRHEALIVPPHASTVSLTVSSSGPPTAMGVYLVDGIRITRTSGNGSEVIFKADFPEEPDTLESKAPLGWVKTGTHPSMAKLLSIGWLTPKRKALYIVDDDPAAHAEWKLTNEASPSVSPKQELLLEWNEIFNIGRATPVYANYRALPVGRYRFNVNELDPTGKPTSSTRLIEFSVPRPYWKAPWFWTICGVIHAALIVLVCRWIIRIRLRKQVARLHEEHLIERERLRIARDIHDDLGARLTHISLVSACAENAATSSKERENFHQISGMTKDLVVALYETVWTVNPENDQIGALLDFICQLTQNLCQAAGVRCRLHTPQITHERRVTSELRHHIVLAVKEAVNNAIKHGKPSELDVRVDLIQDLLSITITDNGCGFDVNSAASGRGLRNMKHRMETASGRFSIEALVGSGTKVHFEVQLPYP